jgi:hypothetical protein
MAFPLDIATFRSRFSAFAGQTPSDALVQAKLDEAEEQIDATVWGTKAEDGHANLTAHLLALEPFGTDARLVAKDGSTVWGTRHEELAKIVGGAYRVVLE